MKRKAKSRNDPDVNTKKARSTGSSVSTPVSSAKHCVAPVLPMSSVLEATQKTSPLSPLTTPKPEDFDTWSSFFDEVFLYYNKAGCLTNKVSLRGYDCLVDGIAWKVFYFLWWTSFVLYAGPIILMDSAVHMDNFHIGVFILQLFSTIFLKPSYNPEIPFRPWNNAFLIFLLHLYLVPLCMNLHFAYDIYMDMSYHGESEGYSQVFCKIDNKTELDCRVDVQNWAPESACDCEINDGSGEWDFCGSWEGYKTKSGRVVHQIPPPAGVLCPVSRPCLSVNKEALVLSAFQHRKKRVGGFKCRFRVDHNWEPESTESMDTSKSIEIKLTTSMLTKMGFMSLQLGNERIQEPEKEKPYSKKYYVGLSGGGWRALTGHMGAFRVLSNKGALSMVDMFSSVSGGTWFLTKLAFDNDFAGKVLGNEASISKVVLEWFESSYFPVFQNIEHSGLHVPGIISEEDVVRSFITTMITQAPGPLKSALGNGIIAFDYFNFSWQETVEQAVLGNISNQKLNTTRLASETLAKFGKDCTLAFNWNQLHQWEAENNKWFLKQVGGEPAQHIQYPVYTSAQYKRLNNDEIEVEVKVQGKPMTEMFQVCHQQLEDDSQHEGISTGPAAVPGAFYATLTSDFVITPLKCLVLLLGATFVTWLNCGKKKRKDSLSVDRRDVSVTVFGASVCAGATGMHEAGLLPFVASVACVAMALSVGAVLRSMVTGKCWNRDWQEIILRVHLRAIFSWFIFIAGALIMETVAYALPSHIDVWITLVTAPLQSLVLLLATTVVTLLYVRACQSKATGAENAGDLSSKLVATFTAILVVATATYTTAIGMRATGLLPRISFAARVALVPSAVAVLSIIFLRFLLRCKPKDYRACSGLLHGSILGLVVAVACALLIETFVTGSDDASKEGKKLITECGDFNFDFGGLTVGQVASASSAAAGGPAVRAWMQNMVEFTRQSIYNLGSGALHVANCKAIKLIIDSVLAPCNRQLVLDEFFRLAGCAEYLTTKQDSAKTAARWSGFFQKMAIKMTVSNSLGKSHMGHMAIDGGYSDNNGLGPILAQYLEDDADQGQILVLLINELGDHQMEAYFNSRDGPSGGHVCDGKITGHSFDKVFKTMDAIHRKSFEDVGGEYIVHEHETTCAIRVPHIVFFEDFPPQQHRFEDPGIPNHITYAYKKGVTIARNDEFYTLPKGKTKKIDLLFLIANAPVSTVSMPEGGSEPYVGTAMTMELATEALAEKFPGFFVQEKK